MQTAPSLRELWTDAIGTIRRGWRSVLVSEVLFKVVGVLVFAPVTLVVLHVLLAGRTSVGNTALIGFALSPKGVATMILLPTLLIAAVLIEQSCLMELMFESAAGRRPRLARALGLTLWRIPRLVGVALRQILIVLGILLPLLLVGGLVYWLLLSDADINFYLQTRPPKFLLAVGIGVVLALIAAVLLLMVYVRMFLAIPVCLSEDLPAGDCLRRSAALARTHFRPVAWAAIGSVLVRLALVQVGLLALAIFNYLILSDQYENGGTLIWVVALVLGVNGVVLAVVAAIERAGISAVGALLYRRLVPEQAAQHALDVPPATPGQVLGSRLAFAAAIVVAFGLMSTHTYLLLHEFALRRPVGVVAHRAGAAGVPENSLSALRRAIAAGATSAEIDVQRSSDGIIMVVHDRDLNRLGRSPLVVGQSTAKALGEVDIGTPVALEFAGERIATLDEFIETARGKIRLSIELKYYGSGDPGLAPAVAQLLETRDFIDQSDVISLDYPALVQMRSINPKIKLGYLVSASIGDLTRLDVNFLSVSSAVLDRRLRSKADTRGLSLACWTVNTRDTMIAAIARGADELVTDQPALAVETIKWYQDLSDPEVVMVHFREWWRGQ